MLCSSALLTILSFWPTAHRSAVAAEAGPAGQPRPVLVVPARAAALYVAVDLPREKLPTPPEGPWQLAELDVRGRTGDRLPAQLVPLLSADGTPAAEHGRLVADIPPRAGAALRRFRLEPAPLADVQPADAQPNGWRFEPDRGRSLKLSDGGRPVLVYNYGTITNHSVPPSDGRRSRACYIHPLWGLEGECLTDDFPKDHYHHHGVFWTWPHVTIDGHEYDLWVNQGIRPEFVAWLGRQSGPAAAVLGVENGWFVGDRKVMIERVWLRVTAAARDERALDLDFTWIPVDRPITLRGAEGKSYGGLTMRFAVQAEKDSTITVPGGSGSADLPDTPLPWADLTAKFPGASAPSGAAIFVPLEHPDYPPTWLTRHYGPLCIGWPGVKGQTFPPGKPIHLSYRIWIHRAAVSPQQLKLAYQAYTTEVQWQE
jgi:hypothetical protein